MKSDHNLLIKHQICKHFMRIITCTSTEHIDGSVQYCSISSALAMEILQSCNKPSIYWDILLKITSSHHLNWWCLIVNGFHTMFSEIWIKIQWFPLKKTFYEKVFCKMSAIFLDLSSSVSLTLTKNILQWQGNKQWKNLTIYMFNYFQEAQKYIWIIYNFPTLRR